MMTSRNPDKVGSVLSLTEANADEIKGKYLRITTINNNKYEGIAVAYIPHQMVMIQTKPDASLHRNGNLSNDAFGLQIINVASIKDVATEKSIPPNTPALIQPSTDIPLEYLKKREDAIIRAEMEHSARLGVGVSKEAQDIFDALSKTLPAAWKGKSIVVMDEIQIDPPYTSTSTHTLPGKLDAETSLNRVKKVLEGERSRLGLK